MVERAPGAKASDSNEGVDRAAPDVVFQPLAQEPGASALFVRTTQPAAVRRPLVEALRAIDPDQPIESVATLAEVRHEAIAPQRLNATLVGLLAQGGGLAVAGLVLGGAGAVAMSRLLAGLLFGVDAWDLPTFAGGAAAMLAVALAASFVPAWRGSRVHPSEALRAE